jgi:hypothetical protein
MTSLANALELRDIARGAEGGDAAGGQEVDEPVDQRRLGPHDDEVDGLVRGGRGHRGHVVDGDVEHARVARDAGVARRAQDLGALRRAPERADDRVLAPARADDEDLQRLAMKSSTGMAASVS